MSASDSERQALVKACAAKDWSKAIRILDSFLSNSSAVQEFCNRVYCYSQLELHKHAIKDCDRALELDSNHSRAYVLKGHALSALGKQGDALQIWEKGHAVSVCQSTDLQQLLELEELVRKTKQDNPTVIEEISVELSTAGEPTSEPGNAVVAKSSNKTEARQPKVSTSSSKPKSITLDLRLSRGIAKVNEGRYDQAITYFNQILKENPSSPEALIGRGTAYAFQHQLESAIADFTKAIQSNPQAGEAWKRCGQARAALGEFIEAIEDLTKALEFEPKSSDILHERGIVNFKFKDYVAAVSDLTSCVARDKQNKSAYTYLGMALSPLGEYEGAEAAHKKALDLDPKFLDGWVHMAQFYQEIGNVEKVFECLQRAIDIDGRFAKAYHVRGMLQHGMGDHRSAIKDLSVGIDINRSNIDCLYLRASCYHAIGEYADAVKDYDAALAVELESVDKFVLQCMSFYQKELALYTFSRVDLQFSSFDIDTNIDPLFKEYWCKRLHPKYVCERVYRQPPLNSTFRGGRIRQQDYQLTKQKKTLLKAADSIGKKIQYDSPGFLPNKRQYRMAGLAAIQIAQKVSRAWRSINFDWRTSNKLSSKWGKIVKRKDRVTLLSPTHAGLGCSTNGSETSTSYSSIEVKSAVGRFGTSWKDVYSLAVKWRQISEPCDPVVWVNKLSDEFNSGFGSHTPLVLGQAKVARYYPYYQRAMAVAKQLMGENQNVNNANDVVVDLSDAEKLQKILSAENCSDLYEVVGRDFWISTPCYSTAVEGKRLDGTRITVQRMGKGFDFAIRTPCTPPRWEEYDNEMAVAWEDLCNTYCCGESYGSLDLEALSSTKHAILRLAYYWYNFMPLSRGTACIGYVVLLGLFLAANMEVTEGIPKGVQVDWEAILTDNFDAFAKSTGSWLFPSIQTSTKWKSYADVSTSLDSTGSVVAALSSNYDEL